MVGPACLDHRGPQAGGVRAGQDGMDGLSLPKGPYPTDGGGEPASPSRAQADRGAVMSTRRSGRGPALRLQGSYRLVRPNVIRVVLRS